MIRESFKTSEDKMDMVCKQNGSKSKICQVYNKEFRDNIAELKVCTANEKKAAA